MKLLCINTEGTRPGLLEVGKKYKLTERYKDCYMIGEDSVRLSNFESPLQMLKRLCRTANKMILSKPVQGTTIDILLTDKYIVCYSHTKGNHWNISGNHYRYYHDIDTGEFIPEHETDPAHRKPLLKERLLVADFKELQKIRKETQEANGKLF